MKKALVTGANSGIGLEIARILAQNGYQITGVARNYERLENEFTTFQGEGHKCVSADLSTLEGIEIVRRLVSERFDVWVNNAGAGLYGDFHSKTYDQLQEMINLNINSLTALSYEYLKSARKGDALINVASVLAFTTFANATTYSGTKAYVVNFSQGLWADFRKKGILVQAFCPGATISDFHNRAGGDTKKMPKFIMQTSQQVAKEFYKSLVNRVGPVKVSGRLNRFFVLQSRILGPKLMAMIQGSTKIEK